jgi:hypothetical protein
MFEAPKGACSSTVDYSAERPLTNDESHVRMNVENLSISQSRKFLSTKFKVSVEKAKVHKRQKAPAYCASSDHVWFYGTALVFIPFTKISKLHFLVNGLCTLHLVDGSFDGTVCYVWPKE